MKYAKLIRIGIVCGAMMGSLRAEDHKMDSMQCCCCMKDKHAAGAKSVEPSSDDAVTNKLIDEFKTASQERKLEILSNLLAKVLEQGKGTETTPHDHSGH